MDRLSAPALGIIQTTGASENQKPHLEFMGVPLGDVVKAGDIPVSWPLAPIDGMRPRSPLHTDALERLAVSGLRDRSSAMTTRIGIHLLRAAPRDGPGSVDTAFDVVSQALLEDMGVSPAWLLLLSALLGGDALVVTDGGARGQILLRQSAVDPEPIMEATIQLEGDVSWNGEGVVLRRPLPETVRQAIVGERLSDVVSHPVLDRFDLTVREVRGTGPVTLDVGHVAYEAIRWDGRATNIDQGDRT